MALVFREDMGGDLSLYSRAQKKESDSKQPEIYKKKINAFFLDLRGLIQSLSNRYLVNHLLL